MQDHHTRPAAMLGNGQITTSCSTIRLKFHHATLLKNTYKTLYLKQYSTGVLCHISRRSSCAISNRVLLQVGGEWMMGRTRCGRPCSYTRVQQSDAHPRTACLLHVLRLPSLLAGGGRSFHPSRSVAANVRCPSSCASTPTSRKEVSPSNEHPHGQQLTTCPSLTDWQAVPLRQEPGSASGWNPWRAVTRSRPHGSGAAARVNIHHWLPQQKGDSHGSTRFYPRDAQRAC
jgi:hypothetical protein